MNVIEQNDIKYKCYIEEHYKVDHSKATELEKNTFVTIGRMFDGGIVCSYCLARLAWFADNYGHDNQYEMRGGVNASAKFSLKEVIERSPLKVVLKDIDFSELKYEIDHHLFELEPQRAIQPNIDSEILRISKARTVR
jgi:hypothetical protein